MIEWQTIDSLPAGTLTCSVFGMGSMAPHEPLEDAARERLGFRGEQIRRPGVRAVGELGNFLGESIGAIIPFELGAFNTIVALDAATRLSIPLIDGAYVGRALPELSQALPAALGFQPQPLAICDHWGNSLLVKDCPSAAVAEMIGKMVSVVTKTPDMFATCAHAAFALTAKDAATALVGKSLTQALEIGRTIESARRSGSNPVTAAAEALEGRLLFEGIVRDIQFVDRFGYMDGTAYVEGERSFSGETARVWFRNENHVLWRGNEVRATSPDLIVLVLTADATPTTNARLRPGDSVSIIAAPCDPQYLKQPLFDLTEPRHYGLDVEYVALREAIT